MLPILLTTCSTSHPFCQLTVQHVSLIKFIIGCITINSIVNFNSSTIGYLSIKVSVHKELWLTLSPSQNYISSLKC